MATSRSTVTIKLALALAIVLFGPAGTAWAQETGRLVVQSFIGHCLGGSASFSALSGSFAADHWQELPVTKAKVLSRLLKLAQSAMMEGGRLTVFRKSGSNSTIYSVVTHIAADAPVVGCYVYGIGADHETADGALKAAIGAPPASSTDQRGLLRHRKWKRVAQFPRHLSITYAYIYPQARNQTPLGIAGVALSTIIIRR